MPLRDPQSLLCCSVSLCVGGFLFLATANLQRLLQATEAQINILQEAVVKTCGDTRASFFAPAAGRRILPGSQSDVHRETFLSQTLA